MSARLFSPVSPANFGRLWPLYFREVATWLLEVYFCALPVTYRASDTVTVIEVFPNHQEKSQSVSTRLEALRFRKIAWNPTVPSKVPGRASNI